MFGMSMDSLRVDMDQGACGNNVLLSIDGESLCVRSSVFWDEDYRSVQTKCLELDRVSPSQRNKNRARGESELPQSKTSFEIWEDLFISPVAGSPTVTKHIL